MSKNQITGFIIFNIGLILSTIFIGRIAFIYDIDVLELIPVFGSLLVMVSGLLVLNLLRDKKK